MSHKKMAIAAGLFGSTIEWYDFVLYANFAPIFAAIFFPSHDHLTALLLTFGIFATGFLIRPFGALIFGYIGDHFGRRTALIASVCIISLPTLLIGMIPTYNQIGIVAPILLICMRLFQGIAVSGEMNSASNFLVEYFSDKGRGLAGSLVMTAAYLGILFGAAASSLTTTLFKSDILHSWGWRVPFWLGGLLGIIGIIIRIYSHETPKFLAESKSKMPAIPLKSIFKNYKKVLFLSIGLICIMGTGNYIFFAFVVTFLTKIQNFSLKDAHTINLISLCASIFFFPVVGALSDKIGRKPIFKAGLVGFVIFSFPIFWLLSQKQFSYALLGDIILSLILVPIAGVIPTLLSELFPTELRNSGTTLSYNLGVGIFGGSAPLIAFKLVFLTGNNFAPAAYLLLCTLISFMSLYFITETYDKPLA